MRFPAMRSALCFCFPFFLLSTQVAWPGCLSLWLRVRAGGQRMRIRHAVSGNNSSVAFSFLPALPLSLALSCMQQMPQVHNGCHGVRWGSVSLA